jgi:23S rRNA (cytosine1962-C5)-methyltransferase
MRVLVTEGSEDYRLIDSGGGRKLERFGTVLVDRPEAQAIWSRRLPDGRWSMADAVFAGDDEDESGRWRYRGSPPDSWPMRIGPITVLCRFSPFRHMGVFPEQLPHWEWMSAALAERRERPRLLNLFGYTGVASLLAAAAGAEVTHVDASKKAVAWAKQNQEQSALDLRSVRWIVEDARKFVGREARRGRTYHGILVDPPKFGRGPNGEVWDLFEDLPELLRGCAALLDGSRPFLILTVYALRASALSFDNLMREVLASRGGSFASGELAVREEGGGRALATSLFTHWAGDGLRV